MVSSSSASSLTFDIGGAEIIVTEWPSDYEAQNSRFEARSAPSRNVRSFAQTTSSATRPQPADVSKPQSEPARTRDGSPTTAATRSILSATTSGCSTILVSGSI